LFRQKILGFGDLREVFSPRRAEVLKTENRCQIRTLTASGRFLSRKMLQFLGRVTGCFLQLWTDSMVGGRWRGL